MYKESFITKLVEILYRLEVRSGGGGVVGSFWDVAGVVFVRF